MGSEPGDKACDFVPSRDLPPLRRGCTTEQVYSSLHALALALGVAEGQREQVDVAAVSTIDVQGAGYDGELSAPSDVFEERYVQQWLTNVAGGRWATDYDDEVDGCIAQASRLIAIMSGQAASGQLLRRYTFESGIELDLDEAAVVEDALGARTWGSATILGNELATQLPDASDHGSHTYNVLELGAGTGLVGLVAAASSVQRSNWHITLTDFDANVLSNLRHNAALGKSEGAKAVDVIELDWGMPVPQALANSIDCLLAADCVYEPQHAELIKIVSEKLLRKPDLEARRAAQNVVDRAKLLLMMPQRATHQAESSSIMGVFPWSETEKSNSSSSALRLCVTGTQDFYGYDDFGPPPLRLQDVIQESQNVGNVRVPPYASRKPRRRAVTYRRGAVHHSPRSPREDTVATADLRDGETCYRLYTIEWRAQ